jgi:hypothetical protein
MQLVLRSYEIRPGAPERQAVEPDPTRHIAEARQLLVRAVDPG